MASIILVLKGSAYTHLLRTALIFIWIGLFSSGGTAQVYITGKNDTLTSKQLSPGQSPLRFIQYTDTTYKFSISLPDWFMLFNTGSDELFMGLFPVTKGIQNSVAIQAFRKSDFPSFDAFANEMVLKYKAGDVVHNNSDVRMLAVKELEKKAGNVRSFKVQLLFSGNNALHQWVLIQTPYSYLHISFSATPDTYDMNIEKFQAFISNIKY